MQPVRITEYCDPNDEIESEYGKITYREWFKRESERIPDCKIIEDLAGRMALVREVEDPVNFDKYVD